MVDVIAPVTDYVSDSLLTTRGDFYKRGVTDVERFPMGAANRIIRVNSAGNDLAYVHPGDDMFENEYHMANAGVITYNTVYADAVLLDMGSVYLDERYFIYAFIYVLKDATPSTIYNRLKKSSGVAVVEMLPNLFDRITYMQAVASKYYMTLWTGVLIVTTAGTLVLKIDGKVDAGQGTIGINNAEIYVHRVKV